MTVDKTNRALATLVKDSAVITQMLATLQERQGIPPTLHEKEAVRAVILMLEDRIRSLGTDFAELKPLIKQ